MGYVTVIGPCVACRRIFGFNPLHVPSTSEITGQREPICVDCLAKINAVRAKQGLELFVPHPEAYEGCDERELPDDDA